MTLERWRQLEAVYHDASGRPAADREAFLIAACGDDLELRQHVESLLAQTGSLPDPFALIADGTETADRSPAPPKLSGRQVGVYQIQQLIDVGGMGAVYRARDTRLGRDVALKILLTPFASNQERVARFEREARLLAAINHPHISVIYGIENLDGISALVLEFVDGHTLAERIRRSSVPLVDALSLARQIVDGLDAAHEKGIIHRDLKPANIKITPDGVVKILDFGIGRLAAPADADASDDSPATKRASTREGVILGTLAYMSPEQARGQAVDRRTDIWAFGCVLYELLSGQRPFSGATASDMVSAILSREPDWEALPSSTPPSVQRLLRRCLEKDPKRRLRDIGDARVELDQSPAESEASGGVRRQRWLLAAPLALVPLALAGGWLLRSEVGDAAGEREPTRFGVHIDPGAADTTVRHVVLSPRGTYIAYQLHSTDRTRLVVRRLNETEGRTLAESRVANPSANSPFFSPDEKWVGYFGDGKLNKVSTDGGPTATLADAPAGRGGTWLDDNSIVFAPLARSGLQLVSADGGPVRQLTTIDAAQGETSHRNPWALPGGETVLFMTQGRGYGDEAIDAVSVRDGHRQMLLRPAGRPVYASTGHLLFQRDRTLMAVRMDAARLAVSGTPVPILENVGASFSVSDNGVLLYPIFSKPIAERLVWVDRSGAAQPVPMPPGNYANPSLAPDDSSLAVTVQVNADRNIWVYHVDKDTFTPLTFGPSNSWAVWHPDGTRIAYAANLPGTSWDLHWKPADGSGTAEALLTRPEIQHPGAFAPDGTLLFDDVGPGGWDVWALTPGRPETLRPLLASPANESSASVSPDGRWLAYMSNESGRNQVYVQSFPGAESRRQVSIEGGEEPQWSRAGTELFFRNVNAMVAIDVTLGSAFSHGKPRILFEGSYSYDVAGTVSYAVTRDGQRFLMRETPLDPAGRLQVVINWFTELQRLVPR
jgi:serine/threonine-protein kinase